MARRKRGLVAEEDEPALDISSLIDVCFLLLIYFILTQTINPTEKDLPMTVPSNQPSEETPDILPMLVTVSPTGQVAVNRDPLDAAAEGKERVLPQLLRVLTEYSASAKSATQEPVIQVYVDPDCAHQIVIDVLNAIRKADINTITFKDFE